MVDRESGGHVSLAVLLSGRHTSLASSVASIRPSFVLRRDIYVQLESFCALGISFKDFVLGTTKYLLDVVVELVGHTEY